MEVVFNTTPTEIGEYLERGEFAEVARLLQQLPKPSDSTQAQVYSLAEQLCLACSQLSQEAQRHRQAQDEVNHRLQALAEQLGELLRGFAKPQPAEPALLGGFWQRLRTMFNHQRPAVARGRSMAVAEPLLPAQATLRVECLGPFRVFFGLEPIEDWQGNKGQAVFKYLLAHHPNPVPKDHLIEALWPLGEPEAGRNRLNVSLHGLRQTLRGFTDLPVVVFEGGAYRLNPALSLSLDVQRFERYLGLAREHEANGQLEAAVAQYENALQNYGGEFLAGDSYEEWVIPLRERLQDGWLEVLHSLAYLYFELEDYTQCIAIGGRLLEADPLREDIHSLRMLSYCRLGREHLALKQYQNCLEAFQRELGSPPSHNIQELFEAIKNHQQV